MSSSRKPSKEVPGFSASRRASRAGAELTVCIPDPAEAIGQLPAATAAQGPLPSDEREFAKRLSIPLRVVQEAGELFRTHADVDSEDWDNDEQQAPLGGTKTLRAGRIARRKAGELLGVDLDDSKADLAFGDFALIYNGHGFAATVMLSPRSRQVRDVAKRHGIGLVDMDRYRAVFDEVDVDGSGHIDVEEFTNAVCRLVRVPAGLELPAKRVQILWKEADTDGTGKLDLEEFIVFYTKYFDASDGCDPLEGFYARPRRNSTAMFEVEH